MNLNGLDTSYMLTWTSAQGHHLPCCGGELPYKVVAGPGGTAMWTGFFPSSSLSPFQLFKVMSHLPQIKKFEYSRGMIGSGFVSSTGPLEAHSVCLPLLTPAQCSVPHLCPQSASWEMLLLPLGSTMCCFKEHIRFYIFFMFLLLHDKVLASAIYLLSDEML